MDSLDFLLLACVFLVLGCIVFLSLLGVGYLIILEVSLPALPLSVLTPMTSTTTTTTTEATTTTTTTSTSTTTTPTTLYEQSAIYIIQQKLMQPKTTQLTITTTTLRFQDLPICNTKLNLTEHGVNCRKGKADGCIRYESGADMYAIRCERA